jgi:hypothetical protein
MSNFEGSIKNITLSTSIINTKISPLCMEFRRSQVFVRRARLLPIVVLLYLAYALAPLYTPSLAPSSERIRYIVSSSPEFISKLNLKNFECYVPAPVLSNIITSCLPIFALFSNRSISPLQLISDQDRNPSLRSPTISVLPDNSIFCFSLLPPTYHFSIILISLSMLH